MQRILSLILAAALLLLTLGGCANATAKSGETPSGTDSFTSPERDEQKLRVVTTIFPPYDFVREIAHDRVELTMLLSPGAESHSYDPTPQDIVTIQDCDLFLYVGGDSDQWVERILESMDTGEMTILSLMELVEVVEEEYVEGMEHNHDHGHDEDDHHEEDEPHQHAYDEHVWTSPQNAMTIVEQISQALCRLDPASSEWYALNTELYLEQLSGLDQAFQELTESARRSTIIFGDRFPFRYFADAYGLEYYAAFPGCSTETEPSAATVAFLMDKVRDESIPVVFYIELSNERMADAIAEDTGAKKLLLHSCHNVSRDDFKRGASYLSLMEQNLWNLKEALN